jgi:MinD-like ATPase involved in chromosome partitioning or flagellar assembly
MTVPVLVAIADHDVEQRVVAAFSRPGGHVAVLRRCVDVPDLIAASSAYAAHAVLLSDGLRRLDRGVVASLQAAGLAVVGLAAADEGVRLLRALGVDEALPAGEDADALTAALVRVVAGRRSASLPAAESHVIPVVSQPLSASDGRVIAVWGPPGAPGRSLVAATLAAEFAALAGSALLVDADVCAAAIAPLVGIVDEVPGVVAAARAANLGELDAVSLAGFARSIAVPGADPAALRVLTGLPRAARWPELRPPALIRVLEVARALAAVTVVDCCACLEQDEELSYDTAVPRRNGATLAVLAEADEILAVGSADPVGVARLVRGLGDLAAVCGQTPVRVVVNRVRPGPIPGDVAAEVAAALQRFGGRSLAAALPEDRPAVDAALAQGRLLVETAAASPFRLAVQALAREMLGQAGGRRRTRVRRLVTRSRSPRATARGR